MKFKIETTGKIKMITTQIIDALEEARDIALSSFQDENDERMINICYDEAIEVVKSFVKKDGEIIRNAFSDAQHGAVESRWTAEEYFEEIFNTKEK